MINRMSEVSILKDTGDFRLLDAKVVQAVRRCREQDRFIRGLIAWAGFRTSTVSYDAPPRKGGQMHFGMAKRLLLALDALISSSITPLRFATVVGFSIAALSVFVAMILFFRRFFGQSPDAGTGFLAAGLFFLGGVQMLVVGILGEYLGRVYHQTRARPLYFLAETIGSFDDSAKGTGRSSLDESVSLIILDQTPNRDRPGLSNAATG
jgi:dolichol-phosphate mannosyltransferase